MNNNYEEIKDNSDEEIINEINKIDKMFPKAKFTVSININKLNNKITNQNYIVIKHTYDCYCYSSIHKKTPKYYYIFGKNITYKFAIKKLIKHGLTIKCNHHFLEDIVKIENTDNFYELFFGS